MHRRHFSCVICFTLIWVVFVAQPAAAFKPVAGVDIETNIPMSDEDMIGNAVEPSNWHNDVLTSPIYRSSGGRSSQLAATTSIAYLKDGAIWLMNQSDPPGDPLTDANDYKNFSVSPNGESLLALTEGGDLHLVTVDSGSTSVFQDLCFPSELRNWELEQVWSPNGEFLLVQYCEDDTSFNEPTRALIVKADGEILKEIEYGLGYFPAWDTTSSYIYYIDYDENTFPSWQLSSYRKYGINDGSDTVISDIPEAIEYERLGHHQPSPNSNWTAIFTDEGFQDGCANYYSWRLSFISESGELDRYPYSHICPDGCEGRVNITANPDGVWSPDGLHYAFFVQEGLAYQAERPDLILYDVENREERVLWRGGGINPNWSPDGNHISFITQEGGVAIVEVNSGEVTQLVASAPQSDLVEYIDYCMNESKGFMAPLEMEAAWSPEGTELLINYSNTFTIFDSDRGSISLEIDGVHPKWLSQNSSASNEIPGGEDKILHLIQEPMERMASDIFLYDPINRRDVQVTNGKNYSRLEDISNSDWIMALTEDADIFYQDIDVVNPMTGQIFEYRNIPQRNLLGLPSVSPNGELMIHGGAYDPETSAAPEYQTQITNYEGQIIDRFTFSVTFPYWTEDSESFYFFTKGPVEEYIKGFYQYHIPSSELELIYGFDQPTSREEVRNTPVWISKVFYSDASPYFAVFNLINSGGVSNEPDASLIFLNLNGSSEVSSVTVRRNEVGDYSGDWSPINSIFAFADPYPNFNQGISFYHFELEDITIPNIGPPAYANPSWHPDGTQIAFTTDQGGLIVSNVDGSNLQSLIEISENDFGDAVFPVPRWSPTGEWILFGQSIISPLNRERYQIDQSYKFMNWMPSAHSGAIDQFDTESGESGPEEGSDVGSLEQEDCGTWAWQAVNVEESRKVTIRRIEETGPDSCSAIVTLHNSSGDDLFHEGLTYEAILSGSNASAEWEPHLHWDSRSQFVMPVLDSDLIIYPADPAGFAEINILMGYSNAAMRFDAGLLAFKSIVDVVTEQAPPGTCFIPFEDIAFIGAQFGYSSDLIIRRFDGDFRLIEREWDQFWERVFDSRIFVSAIEDCSIDGLADSQDINQLKLRSLIRFYSVYGAGITYEILDVPAEPIEFRIWYENN